MSVFYKIPAGFCPTMSYGSRKRGYDQGGCVLSCPRIRHITSNPSQTLCRRLVRTADAAVSTRRSPPSVEALFFAVRDSYG